MTILLIFFISILCYLFSKFIFKFWFNPLSIYTFVWASMLFLYDLNLMSYNDLKPSTWFYILGAYLAFILGILSCFYGKKMLPEKKKHVQHHEIILFKDDGKVLRYVIWFLSSVTLAVAIQNWYVLLKMFGTLQNVILNIALIYQLRVGRQIQGTIPYFGTIGYSAVLLSGIYTAYRNKVSLTALIPFLGIILSEIANVGRAGMLLSFFIFFTAYILMRRSIVQKKQEKFLSKNIIITFAVIIFVIILSASFIRSSRGVFEHYAGGSRALRTLNKTEVITPSVYLYFSAHVGVFNKYLQLESEHPKIGENSFLFLYSILSKFNVIKRPSDYQKGYFIPMWVNTGTYLREIHADFGIIGVLGIPYLLGLVATFLWFRFFKNNNISVLAILVFIFAIIEFSYITMITRLAIWVINFILTLILIPIIQFIVNKRSHSLNY